jgi:hypothetical protein
MDKVNNNFIKHTRTHTHTRSLKELVHFDRHHHLAIAAVVVTFVVEFDFFFYFLLRNYSLRNEKKLMISLCSILL